MPDSIINKGTESSASQSFITSLNDVRAADCMNSVYRILDGCRKEQNMIRFSPKLLQEVHDDEDAGNRSPSPRLNLDRRSSVKQLVTYRRTQSTN